MTKMSRERREELKRRAPTPEEVDALLSDSAWRERVERQVRELAEIFDTDADMEWHINNQDGANAYYSAASMVRRIVDTGDEEGD